MHLFGTRPAFEILLGNGETGAARVVWYGYSTYDYNSDSLTYKACDGKGWFGC